jgi:SAM-dependent methyltransferase
VEEIRAFRERLAKLKQELKSPEFEWYPYDSLSVFDHLGKLLHGEHRDLKFLAGAEPVLDIGCADGDLAFLLDSLGFRVRAIDHPATNINFMRGFSVLREALGANVKAAAVDLDSEFHLPDERYGLVLFLGILYHLKNPFYVLERLSRHGRWCLLSTRISAALPPGAAYLAAPREFNDDITNFWFFSEGGLRRLCERAGWEVKELLTVPGEAGDVRAFLLARSTWPWQDLTLDGGWYEDEGRGWRWTKAQFGATWRNTRAVNRLKMLLYVPQALIARQGTVRLSVAVNGTPAGVFEYARPGDHPLELELPEAAAGAPILRAGFHADGELEPDEFESRRRALIVWYMRFE